MEHLFVPYELAVKLKEKGFNEPCIGWATKEYPKVIHIGISFKIHKENDLPTRPFNVPLHQQVIDWFREKHSLAISVPNPEFGWYKILGSRTNIDAQINNDAGYGKSFSNSQILNKAIEEAIKLI